MTHRFTFSLLLVCAVFSFYRCSMFSHSASLQQSNQMNVPGPKAIIYQTNNDYSKLVPVTLSPDRMTILSYPDIRDVLINGIPCYPTLLHGGYLLDNRGITPDVAFIRLTYDDYAALPETPTGAELMNMIVDKKPIKIMYSCGLRSKFGNINEELNTLIDAGDFSGFIRLK